MAEKEKAGSGRKEAEKEMAGSDRKVDEKAENAKEERNNVHASIRRRYRGCGKTMEEIVEEVVEVMETTLMAAKPGVVGAVRIHERSDFIK